MKKIPHASVRFTDRLLQGTCQLFFALFIPLKQVLYLTGCLISHGIVLEMRYLHFKMMLDTNGMQKLP